MNEVFQWLAIIALAVMLFFAWLRIELLERDVDGKADEVE